ncbi:MAG: zinc ribbon domain-containing protein [Thermoleophilia bacterium]|nr:zinc ribbon domain-containing protein [Thermoleophilia bacterium]
MPIYEYRCTGCGAEFEELVSLAAAEQPQTCPECGLPSAERLLSISAVRVSGGGTPSSGKSCAGCRKSSCATC